MQRFRVILGLVAGLMFILSSAAHSLLGWTRLRDALVQAGAPSDLIVGLSIGWHFAGVSMLAFGVIVLLLFARRSRNVAGALAPALVIAVAYLAFGAWALTVSNLEPFFLVAYVVPGLLLLLAAWGARGEAGASLSAG